MPSFTFQIGVFLTSLLSGNWCKKRFISSTEEHVQLSSTVTTLWRKCSVSRPVRHLSRPVLKVGPSWKASEQMVSFFFFFFAFLFVVSFDYDVGQLWSFASQFHTAWSIKTNMDIVRALSKGMPAWARNSTVFSPNSLPRLAANRIWNLSAFHFKYFSLTAAWLDAVFRCELTTEIAVEYLNVAFKRKNCVIMHGIHLQALHIRKARTCYCPANDFWIYNRCVFFTK